MLRILYNLLIYLLQPIVLLLMWQKGGKSSCYRHRLGERYGFYGKLVAPKPNGIVIHAASVGEVIAATPLIKQLQAVYPDLAVTITTVTPTGSARVKAAFGESVTHIYLPYDLPFAVKRFLNFIQPKLFVVIETELWPNLIRQSHQQGIPFVIANARLSPRSAKRYNWISAEMRTILSEIEMILAQDQVSATRYIGLGFPENKLFNTGNLKFDVEISPQLREKVTQTQQQLGINNRPVWIAGSTHEGEEKMVLEAHQALLKHYPDLLLILVPRHPERFDSVEHLIRKSTLNYTKRSEQQPTSTATQVILGDTMGEMMCLYGLAHIAFIGGSLVKHGGHNPLEPIAFEIPVISGIYTFNFPEIFAKLREVNGVLEIQSNSEHLAEAVDFLLKNSQKSQEISQAGLSVLQENQGSLQRHLEKLAPYIEANSIENHTK